MHTTGSYAVLLLVLASCGREPDRLPTPGHGGVQGARQELYAGHDIAYWIDQLASADSQGPAIRILSAIGPPAVPSLLATAKNNGADDKQRARAVGILGNIGMKFPRAAARIRPELLVIAASDAGHCSGTAEDAAERIRAQAGGTVSPDAADSFWRRNESWDTWWEGNRERITKEIHAGR